MSARRPPAFKGLLILCWVLRVLAFVSIAAMVKLGLMWSDAGASTTAILFAVPIALGITATMWGLAEALRVLRDIARGQSHE